MKPVEIEFLMKDNLTGGLDKAGLAVDILQQKAVKAAEDIGRKITDQKGVIRGIETDLRRMESALTGMKPGTAQKELALDVAACRKVLDEERSSLEALEKEHAAAEASVRKLKQEYDALSSSQSSAGSTAAGLKERLREQKAVVKQIESDVKALEKAYRSAAPGGPKIEAAKDLNASRKALEEEKAILSELQREYDRTKGGAKRLTMQLREMQDAMARMRLSGQQNTEEYRKMAAEAANLSDTLQDLNTQTRILSNDDANLQGFMSGMSGLAGILTTATGALSLFATENENLQKIQTRLQSVMAVTMGLQQVFNTLNKDSAFRLVTVVRMKKPSYYCHHPSFSRAWNIECGGKGTDGNLNVGAIGCRERPYLPLGSLFFGPGKGGGETARKGGDRKGRPGRDDKKPLRDRKHAEKTEGIYRHEGRGKSKGCRA